MKDEYLKAHFDLSKRDQCQELSFSEMVRIRETVNMVPANWKRILDVGCGDGRVSRELAKKGFSVMGIDWSRDSIQHFPGMAISCDIRDTWPINERFDGIVCCEVLEHLQVDDARKIIAQIASTAILGFLITVPANENLGSNIVTCPHCGNKYHIWGHMQNFNGFSDVDRMVQLDSSVRKHINPEGRKRSDRYNRWRSVFGSYPYDPSYLCPWCGMTLPPPTPHMLESLFLKGISLLNRVTVPFQPEGGWYACRYDFH